MRQYFIKTVLIFSLWLLASIVPIVAFSQDRFEQLEKKLSSMVAKVPELNETVDISVNGVSIQEFLRGIANNVKININVDPALTYKVVNNFTEVRVLDILLFVCREYNLDIKTVGNIISVIPYAEQVVDKPKKIEKRFVVNYEKASDLLSLELNNDSLVSVAKEITDKSGKNIILSSNVSNKFVNGYIQNMPFDNVLEKFAYANDLQISKTDDNFYLIDKKEIINNTSESVKNNKTGKNNSGNTSLQNTSGDASFQSSLNSIDSISVNAVKTPIIDIINSITDKLKINYLYVSELKGDATLNVQHVSFEKLLELLFNGTDFTYKLENGIYLIGEKKVQELKSFRVIQLQYRTVEKLTEVIPADLKKDIEVKEFTDLNSLVLTGPSTRLDEIEKFIKEVDKVVPVILIEVMIAEVTRKKTKSTGITAGLGENPVKTGGSVFPTVDFQLNSSTINDLISGINGFGWIKLGKVTPNFYMNIKAMEDEGYIKIKSTPKLSTMNGHEATLSIGKTEYYLEESNNVIGSQNPQNIITRTYKSINADLSITIKPIVSGDDQVTLDLKVQQSDFTARISTNAPPGAVTRNFNSLIRVKNQEMVLLGGLEQKSVGNSGRGIPWLSEIPVLKWIFSSRTKEDSKSILNIFIKPTIIY
jgi:type IV pilus assembly protein PilQ